MLSFCAVFNCSSYADKEKDKSNYRFFSIVKNNSKEDLKLSKVKKEEKWLAQIFRKDLTETKLEATKTRTKIMLSVSPSSVFLHKIHNIRFEKQIHILTLTNGNRTWTYSAAVIHLDFKVLWTHWFSTQISYKKNKKLAIHRFRTGIPLTGNLHSTITQLRTITPCSTYSMMESLKLLYLHIQNLGTMLEILHFP